MVVSILSPAGCDRHFSRVLIYCMFIWVEFGSVCESMCMCGM